MVEDFTAGTSSTTFTIAAKQPIAAATRHNQSHTCLLQKVFPKHSTPMVTGRPMVTGNVLNDPDNSPNSSQSAKARINKMILQGIR